MQISIEVENATDEELAEFLAAMTGDDHDVLLAAELAMRKRLGWDTLDLLVVEGPDLRAAQRAQRQAKE